MKSINTFGVKFIIRTGKTDKKNALLYLRITINKKVIEISLKQKLETDCWDNAREHMRGHSPAAKKLNAFIQDIKFRVMQCFQELLKTGEVISVESIKSLFLAEKKNEHTVQSLLIYHNKNMQGLLKPGTLKNYSTTEKYVLRFLKEKMNLKDLTLIKLNYQFISEFEVFLRTCKPLDESNRLNNNGIMKHLERLKKITALAVKLDWIPKNPFAHYQLKLQKTEMGFLSKDELKKLENAHLTKSNLEKVRDLFIFSCYTGLSYIDASNLSKNNIYIGSDGEYWIKIFRQKTNIQVNLPLLPKALELLTKYEKDPQILITDKLLPFFTNQKVNAYLKKIAKICDIDKDLTFHLARHTFSTTVTLANGVPVETVSRMLGHTKLSTTQIYVHVLERKISEDMRKLKQVFSKEVLGSNFHQY